jgi:hypothetical protein
MAPLKIIVVATPTPPATTVDDSTETVDVSDDYSFFFSAGCLGIGILKDGSNVGSNPLKSNLTSSISRKSLPMIAGFEKSTYIIIRDAEAYKIDHSTLRLS